MTQFLETACNVSFDQPGDSSPMVVDFSQRRVTSTCGARIHASSRRTAAQSTLPAGSVSLLAPVCQTRRAYSQHTTPFTKPSVEWVTVTHPHHPLSGQRVRLIRVRRGPEPDLIIRLPDGYHRAIAASLTDYGGPVDSNLPETPPPLLSIEGLWQIAQWVAQQREHQSSPGGHAI